MATNYRILGKIEAERPCDCCGNKILKVAVVIDLEGVQVHYGRDCAGRLLYGCKSLANARKAEKAADAADYAAKMGRDNRLRRVSKDKNRANYLYAGTRRGLDGSFFAVKGSDVVRVDGKDEADVAFFLSEGFERV